MEDVGDGFPEEGVAKGGAFVAAAVAVRAGDVEIGEELHFHFFEAVAGAAVAAALAGVEGEEAGLEPGGFRAVGLAEELTDGIEGTEEDGGGGAGGAGDGGLVDKFDAVDILCS